MVAACNQVNPMALPARLGPVKASLAVDTGAAVNVLSERAYQNIKRASRGSRWSLRPNDLVLKSVNNEALNILGIVRLPVSLGKKTTIHKVDFYVVANFSLPTDGLLGLTSLKSHKMVIKPDTNVILYQGRCFRAMDPPMSLTALPKSTKELGTCASPPQVGVLTVATTSTTSSVSRDVQHNSNPITSSVSRDVHHNSNQITSSVSRDVPQGTSQGNWKQVRATVVGNHDIPSRTAMHVPVSVPDATVGCDICIEGPSQMHRLSVEPTLSTVRDTHKATALVVNTTCGPIKLKQGLFLSKALVYDKRVIPEPLEFPQACVASVEQLPGNSERGQDPTLSSFVTVADYPDLKQPLLKLLGRYRDVIALPGEPLGATTCIEHHIRLKPDTKPVYVPAYRLPHSQRQIVEDHVKDMKAQGVIQDSLSPWNSPIFLVPKKDGSFRPVIDYRRVNEVTETEKYPLPVLKDLLMSLGEGNTIFSSLDLLSGYWQVKMAPSSRAITAFSTPNGHFEFKRMPFGLAAAPISFSRMMNTLLSDLLGKNVYAYLDDVIIYNKDPDSHFETLEKVLSRLKSAGLKAKLTKCEFLKERISFLGHQVDYAGIHTMDDKIKAVKDYPRPQSVDKVRSFLGLCGYYRSFVKGFATIASPLTKLTRKDQPFHWHDPQEKSFQELKRALINAPILAFPNYSAPFVLYTDASGTGVGAVLMQQDDRGKNRVIAYASRTLNAAESNYSVTHLETLAVVWALKHFRDVVYGYPVTVFTDHAAVTELFKGRNLSGRLARWYLTIQEFNPTFKYLPGRANVVADALSRNVPVGAVTDQDPVVQNLSLHELVNAQRQNDLWSKVRYALESGDETSLPKLPIPFSQFFLSQEGALCRYLPHKREPVSQFVIPESYVPTILHLIHDDAIAGHPGRERTLIAARKKFYWPTMKVDIDSHISKCVKCAQHKGTVPKPAPILQYPPPEGPWDVVAIDLLQLPASHQGSRYVLVCVDHFSRYVVLAPLPNKTADAVAHALITHLFCPYSTPRVLLSDNGAEFRNALLKEICNQFQIKQTFTVTYHPSSNGLVERANRKIIEVLRPIVGRFVDTWEDWISHVAASINSNVCESTGKTPYFILYGKEKRLPYDLLEQPQKPVYNMEDYSRRQLKVFSDIHKDVKRRLLASKTEMSKQQHRRSAPVNIRVGESVMVKVPERNSKLAPKFVGPRLVVNQIQPHRFELFDPWLNTIEVVHSDRIKKTGAKLDLDLVTTARLDQATRLNDTSTQSIPQDKPSHSYNLRSRQ